MQSSSNYFRVQPGDLKMVFGAFVIAFVIAASVQYPWLAFFVIPLLLMNAIAGVLALWVWHGRNKLEIPIRLDMHNILGLHAVFASALVILTALFAGYPTSASLSLTGRLALIWVASQEWLREMDARED